MTGKRGLVTLGIAAWFCAVLNGQQHDTAIHVQLQVKSGTPLRLYLTKRTRFRVNEAIEARVAEPVWAFDRIVIPAGTLVSGRIVQLTPVPRSVRAMACVRGDFTPLKTALASFQTLELRGETLALADEPSAGLASIYQPPRPNKADKAAKPASNTKAAQAGRFLKQQAITQANARSHGMLDFVRSRNKREWLVDLLWSKLPWHPQWYRAETRFDTVLTESLNFGQAVISQREWQSIGSAPPADSPALLRFETTTSSATAKVGDHIEGVLSEPLFNAAHQLVLPQGTQLTGTVTLARPARYFHRGGQLRFRFNRVELANVPALAAHPAEPADAQLTAAEPARNALTVDDEGTAKAAESKTRFLRPLIAGLVAAKSLDNDAGRSAASGGASANYGGRSLGGFSGFGLFGTALSFGPRYIGSAFGFYGLAWSVYSTVISRGREVSFQKNAALAIRFGVTRPSAK